MRWPVLSSFRRGTVQDYSYDDQRNRASGLNLVLTAIIVWNTVLQEQTVTALRAEGQDVQDEHLPHLAPLGWERIILTGEYLWDLRQATRLSPDTAVADAGKDEEDTSQSEPIPPP